MANFLTDLRDFFLGTEREETEQETRRETEQERLQLAGEETRRVEEIGTTAQTQAQAAEIAEETRLIDTVQSQLDPETLETLRNLIPQLASAVSAPEVAQELTGAAVERVSGLDERLERIIQSAQTGARREFETGVLPQISQIANLAGGSATTNTLVNELQTQAFSDLAKNLASIEADVLLRGEELAGEEIRTAADVSAGGLQQLLGVVQGLSGAEVSTIGTEQGLTTTDIQKQQITGSESVTNTEEQRMLSELVESLVTEIGVGTGETTGTGTIFDLLNVLAQPST